METPISFLDDQRIRSHFIYSTLALFWARRSGWSWTGCCGCVTTWAVALF